MAIARTQAVSNEVATSVAITSTSNNDIIIVWAYGFAATIPSLPAGFTSIVGTAGTQQAAILGYKISTGGDTSSGVWTNASAVVCMVYSGCNTGSPFGTTPTITAGSSTAVTYSAVTVLEPATSVVLGFTGAKSATSGVSSNPTGGSSQFTKRTNFNTVQGCDTVSPIGGNYVSQTLTVSPTSRWQSVTIELKAVIPVVVLPELITQPLTPPRFR